MPEQVPLFRASSHCQADSTSSTTKVALTNETAGALGIILEGIFYGAYMVLFTLYLVLQRRNNCGFGGLLTLAQILLFGLCTISLCLDISVYYFFVASDVANEEIDIKLNVSSLAIFTITDYLAQMILLYRCWIIWDRRWMVVGGPGLLAFVAFGGGLALIDIDNSPDRAKVVHLSALIGVTVYSISLAVNALATALIVIKILLTTREVRPVLGSDSHRSLHIVTAMVIESGLLMLAFQLAFVILFRSQSPAVRIVANTITQIYGITPTLLNIRVVMGSAYDKTTEKTRSLRFAHSGGAATQTTGPSMSMAGVWNTDSELNEYIGDLNNLREETQRLREENDRLRKKV
ncbi:hypothetical protein BD779DRAFT_1799675 [Infundibulicybe gibba]|nr:hypothetical protein BD779DRAFT_1799675 [Infundibulicybe gibba]